jgi:hypothetical protein
MSYGMAPYRETKLITLHEKNLHAAPDTTTEAIRCYGNLHVEALIRGTYFTYNIISRCICDLSQHQGQPLLR